MRVVVSIHAPARGATPLLTYSIAPRRRFNPRSRTGSDDGKLFSRLGIVVSIHAPARGATKSPSSQQGARPVSIHAPARGATSTQPGIYTPPGVSIHAPARGATVAGTSRAIGNLRFNPRSRTGSDNNKVDERTRYYVFQSTLPHGERRSWAVPSRPRI